MKNLFFIILFFFMTSIFAQQEPLFSQYYMNDMITNPAISGSKAYNPLTIKTRQQWLGFEGAPLTSNISYHGALNNRSAMGGYLMFDNAYPSMQINLHLNYAYHIPLDYDKVNLSFGLGAKVMYYSLDFNRNDLPPERDPAFSSSSYNKTLGDASSGVYLYGKSFCTGFSVSNMFQSTFNDPISSSPYSNSELRNYYGSGAYRFRILNNDWKIEPSFLIRKTQYQRSITDLSTRVFYLENLWAGIAYRTNKTAIFSLGFGINNMYISYTYDHAFAGKIMQYNYGTHEIGITFRIPSVISENHIGFSEY